MMKKKTTSQFAKKYMEKLMVIIICTFKNLKAKSHLLYSNNFSSFVLQHVEFSPKIPRLKSPSVKAKTDCETREEKPPAHVQQQQLAAFKETLKCCSGIPERESDKRNLLDHRHDLLERRRKFSLEDLQLGVPVVPRDKLEISRFLLAEGGQALIKKGKFRGSDVIVKSFPRSRETYLAFREMKLLDRVRHPNIILLMGVSEGLEDYYVIMEYYDSYSLHSVLFTPCIKDTYKLTEFQKDHMVKQICLALNYLHLDDYPIIHRDMKPSNILVEWSHERRTIYNIKLCDLGMSKCKRIFSALKTSEGNCQVRGTQFYNAPEIMRREETCTKSKVWATGCTFLEIYTEQRAWQFEATDIVKDEVREAILLGKSPNVGNAPIFGQKFLLDMFKFDRRERCDIEAVLEVINEKISTAIEQF